MQITFNTLELSKDAMIELATMLSHEIDRLALESQSLSKHDYEVSNAQLTAQFNAVCHELKTQWEVVLSDCVPFPQFG